MFSFTDKDYNDFKEFLKKRNFSYKTVTEESLNELIDVAKKEKYYDQHEDLFLTLEKDLAHTINEDLDQFRTEITELIEDEIMRRYFYESGAIASTIKKDEQIIKAMQVLDDKKQYASLLNGISGSAFITTSDSRGEKSKRIVPVERRERN